ncbi:hypothetical protein T05_10505 [Trichinella murrelli]|uniref:Uncharacterized protein n=1 Tax=Trichinella murrelli TaxID=144512 RepID=A0A0V0TU25_9BILA|nr:hypothetical protein T05_10505 [Trichinella murrelli]
MTCEYVNKTGKPFFSILDKPLIAYSQYYAKNFLFTVPRSTSGTLSVAFGPIWSGINIFIDRRVIFAAVLDYPAAAFFCAFIKV